MTTLRDLPSLDLAEIDFRAESMDVDRAIRAYRDVGFIIVRGLMRAHMEQMAVEVTAAVQVARRELPEATLMRYGWLTTSGAIFTDRVGQGNAPPGYRQLIAAPISTESSKTMKACAMEPGLHRFLNPLLDQDANLIGTGQCMYKEALHGNEAGLHQDGIYPGGEAYSDVITAFTYMVPTSVERGCIWLVPYSYRLGLLAHEETGPRVGCIPTDVCDFDSAVPLPGEPGDTLLWNYTLIHGSKPNFTNVARPTVVTRYGRMRSNARAAGK